MGRPATLRVDIVTDAKGSTRGIDATDSRLSRFGRSARKVGRVAGIGLAAVGVAAVAGGKQVVDSASRQQQAYGALDAIYGKNSKVVKRWARGAADDVGLAKSEYAELSSLIGAQLTGMGFSVDKATGKSRDLIKTGADLAATFGGSTKEAVEALSSVLKGETDPIERYGVSIKQSDINARLAAQGQDKLKGAALKTATAQAALTLVSEQTAKAHGAFARESNTLAGQQERLKAKFENTKATIGAKLLPVLTALFGWVNNKLFPGVGRLSATLSAKFGPTLTRVGAWITGRLVPALRQLWTWFVTKVYPSIRSAVIPILNGLRSAFGSVSASVQRNSGTLSGIARVIGKVIVATGPLRVLFGKTLGLAFKLAGIGIGALLDNLTSLWNKAVMVGNGIQWLIDKVRALGNLNPGKYLDKLGGLFGAVDVHRMVSPTTTGLGLAPRGALGLTTSSLTTAELSPLSLDATRGASVASYVDARDLSTHVTLEGGTLYDPRVLSELERKLEQHRTRLGHATAFGRR